MILDPSIKLYVEYSWKAPCCEHIRAYLRFCLCACVYSSCQSKGKPKVQGYIWDAERTVNRKLLVWVDVWLCGKAGEMDLNRAYLSLCVVSLLPTALKVSVWLGYKDYFPHREMFISLSIFPHYYNPIKLSKDILPEIFTGSFQQTAPSLFQRIRSNVMATVKLSNTLIDTWYFTK